MQDWQALVEKSEFYMYCKNLTTGAAIARNETARLETASVIKLPILLAVLDKVQRRELSLRQSVHVRRADVGKHGSGVMKYFYLHQSFELYNLLVLMTSVSDNVATNAIIRLIGRNTVNQFMQSLGFSQTELTAEKLDFPAGFSLESSPGVGLTTPKEMATLVERLMNGELLDQANTKIAMKLLQQVQASSFQSRLPRRKIKKFGSKTGGLFDDTKPLKVMNDAGYIIDADGNRYVFTLFSTLPIDRRYRQLDLDADITFSKVAARLFHDLSSVEK